MSEAPCEVWFYHLERSALEQVLPELLERTLQRGWRALVVSPDAGRLERLDEVLWTWRDDSFLPHGLAGEPFAADQPILLSTSAEPINGAHALFVTDGDPGAFTGFERCAVIFDGASESALADARRLWSRYRQAGLAVTYWRQLQSRGWEKQS